MLNPDLRKILKEKTSRYSLVRAVAKRAREIADNLCENNEILEEKPVKTAVEEFASRKYYFVEDSSLRSAKD